MNKICTSIEQSKTLLKLGLDINTADMCYPYDRHLNKMYGDTPYVIFSAFNREVDIPAWSLSALLELMPLIVDNWYIELHHREDGYYFDKTNMYSDSVDAAYEMVVWLLENKKL